ncbi:MAG: electron transfer flavoprotein subunit beta/FixA family protein [Pseudomonadota bacterium]
MNIFVLIKQVPDTESKIQIDASGASINTDKIKWIINPYDELAIEEALQLRDAVGGSVTVFSLGSEKVDEALRSALAMGADIAVRIDPGNRKLDGLSLAKLLAGELQKEAFDLIIAGCRAVDDDNSIVGPAVAQYLNIPHISMVIDLEVSDGRISCTRTVEGGNLVLESSLPALITTQQGINAPRFPSLRGSMLAKKKNIETRTISETENSTIKPMVSTIAMRLSPQRTAGRIIEGDNVKNQAAELVRLLKQEIKVF